MWRNQPWLSRKYRQAYGTGSGRPCCIDILCPKDFDPTPVPSRRAGFPPSFSTGTFSLEAITGRDTNPSNRRLEPFGPHKSTMARRDFERVQSTRRTQWKRGPMLSRADDHPWSTVDVKHKTTKRHGARHAVDVSGRVGKRDISSFRRASRNCTPKFAAYDAKGFAW